MTVRSTLVDGYRRKDHASRRIAKKPLWKSVGGYKNSQLCPYERQKVCEEAIADPSSTPRPGLRRIFQIFRCDLGAGIEGRIIGWPLHGSSRTAAAIPRVTRMFERT